MRDACYNIPLLPSNLRKEETVKQLTDTLKYLENVSDDIFKRVDNQVEEQSKKLEIIGSRLEIAKRKIEHIKGSNKAIQVFSSSKYPADEELPLYNSIFKDIDSALQQVTTSYKKVQSKHLALSEAQIHERTKFYLVPRNRSKSNADQNEGLGGLPGNISAISSLLLFNSSENPYKKYSIFDPLGATTKTKSGIEEQAKENGIGDAPMSISNREQMDRPTAENYFYIPDLGDVPEIDVPMDLPDLPGIADLSFTSQLGDGIAPSLMAISSLPDLPEVSNQPSDGVENAVPSSSTAAVPPPPPPPASVPPPPPPPPPPPVAPLTEAPASSQAPKEAPKEVTNPDSGRANLLASIRAAGGSGKAKLKSSKERKLEKKKAKEEAKASESSGGDLMSDLFSKLAMRRKGISGSNSKTASSGGGSESTGGGSAMDKISAMIPPPSQNHSNNNEVDNSEWE